MSRPSKRTRPVDGASTPAIVRRRVDLPLPLLPSKATTSPRRTVNDTPFTARSLP
jgi:hypothetical protein